MFQIHQSRPIAYPPLQKPQIRPLTADDCEKYRHLRQEILRSPDNRFFSDSYTREQKLTESGWKDWCSEKREHCIFGTFISGELVGIYMVTQLGRPEDLTVEWEATWLSPQYRRSGLTAKAYQHVEQWTVEQGYKFVKVFIREDNKGWLAIRKKQGFKEVGLKLNEVWADGTRANAIALMLDLEKKQQSSQLKAASYLSKLLGTFDDEIATHELNRRIWP